ncbi:MAG: hypothetical protein V1659_02490 [Candidatus Woesearchaeota archaeon]
MKKLLAILVALVLVLPAALAISVGGGITPVIETENFGPLVWLCDNRIVMDDAVEWGRVSLDGEEMFERINNYAFEGEQIAWLVLVMDKNGVPEKLDVYGAIGTDQDLDIDGIEVNCEYIGALPGEQGVLPECNARIDEEMVEWNGELMGYYQCTLTVETPLSMYGEYWVTIAATDLDDLTGTMDENEYWFFNPVIALSIDGTISFEDVRPGTDSYSDTLLLTNDAEDGSGVMLDMFISGTDFYDSSSSGAMCPTTNQLSLSTFRYFATNGAYSTYDDLEADDGNYDPITLRDSDVEGYVNIQYGDHFDRTMYDEAEILQEQLIAPYYVANILAPGADMAITFKLSLPEPCNGDFDTGSLYFWAEAI